MPSVKSLIVLLIGLTITPISGCSKSSQEKVADKKTLPETPEELVSAKDLYDANCGSCHDISRDGAPRLGFKRVWEKRIAQGKEVMVANAIEGIGLMPAKGENPDLTEGDISSIVDYIIYRANLNIPAKR